MHGTDRLPLYLLRRSAFASQADAAKAPASTAIMSTDDICLTQCRCLMGAKPELQQSAGNDDGPSSQPQGVSHGPLQSCGGTPAASAASVQSNVAREVLSSAAAEMQRPTQLRILVAEDNAVNQMVIMKVLRCVQPTAAVKAGGQRA